MAKKKNKKEEIKKQEQEVKDDDKTGEETIDRENQEDSLEKEKSQVEDETKNEQESESELKDKQLEEINNKLLRLQADFLNYKTRTEKEKFKYYNDAIEDLVCEMLPILDNFERALENLESDENLSQGVEMILNQFINLLKKYGVEEIDALGKKFDPKLHHGVSTEDTDEEEDIVVEVFQKGYKLKDKVIRPSMVKISK
ncbi:MAG TPA: nucleotide exchange factor GrpE [Clostridiales bacterium]|jgi:molecular chaperone GrpE|nr:nucleotide exchange factor GrpE [Clostridiales bacterium]